MGRAGGRARRGGASVAAMGWEKAGPWRRAARFPGLCGTREEKAGRGMGVVTGLTAAGPKKWPGTGKNGLICAGVRIMGEGRAGGVSGDFSGPPRCCSPLHILSRNRVVEPGRAARALCQGMPRPGRHHHDLGRLGTPRESGERGIEAARICHPRPFTAGAEPHLPYTRHPASAGARCKRC